MTNREFCRRLSNKELAVAIRGMYEGAIIAMNFKDPNITITIEEIIENYLGEETRRR